MKKILSVMLLASSSVVLLTACNNSQYEDMQKRLEELEKQNKENTEIIEGLTAHYKFAASKLEDNKLQPMIDAFKGNTEIDKTMWQKYMPATITLKAEIEWVDSYGSIVPKIVKEYCVGDATACPSWRAQVKNQQSTIGDNQMFFHGFQWKTASGDVIPATGNFSIKLYKSPFNRQYLAVDPSKCTYPGYLVCNAAATDMNITEITA